MDMYAFIHVLLAFDMFTTLHSSLYSWVVAKVLWGGYSISRWHCLSHSI